MPAAFIQGGGVLASLMGTVTVLNDGGFDDDVEPARQARFDDPVLGLRFGDVDSGIGENLEGHVDVGPAGHTVTPVAQVERKPEVEQERSQPAPKPERKRERDSDWEL